MRPLLALGVLCIALAGCSSASSDADNTVKAGSGVAINPSGKPKDANEVDYANKMSQMGQNVNDARAKEAEAMAAARARAGG